LLLKSLLGETNCIDNILERVGFCKEEVEQLPSLSFEWKYAQEQQQQQQHVIEGSDYQSKKGALFQFEKQLARVNVYVGRFGEISKDVEDADELFGEWKSGKKFANRLWGP
jgi:hypothetical protein